MGLPVVAVPAGGVADHLRDGINGFAVPADDVTAMAAAMVDHRHRPRADLPGLARGARATAEALSWDRELDRLDASYREVIAGSEPRRDEGDGGGRSSVGRRIRRRD